MNDILRTSWSTDGKVPPSLNRPHPVTVAFSPMSRSSEPGKHMGTMCCVYLTGESSRTMARSYSYVKKLYLGCTIFRTTERSTNGYGSWSDEKSYSPILMRICDVSKLRNCPRIRIGTCFSPKLSFFLFFFFFILFICVLYSLFDAMAGRRYPVLVEQSSSAPVRARKPEERRPTHRNLYRGQRK